MRLCRHALIVLVTVCLSACGASRDSGQDNGQNRSQTQVIDLQALERALEAGEPLLLLDVRTPGEFAEGHIEGSINIPSYALVSRMSELEPYRDRRIVAYCEVGPRAYRAAAALNRAGYRAEVYPAGMGEWRRRSP